MYRQEREERHMTKKTNEWSMRLNKILHQIEEKNCKSKFVPSPRSLPQGRKYDPGNELYCEPDETWRVCEGHLITAREEAEGST